MKILITLQSILFRKLLILFVVLGLFSAHPRAEAGMDFGDAALTVGISSGVGAVLGASTLPFYSASGKHLKNIFYGAAIGAVLGVFVSASMAMQQPDTSAALAEKTTLARSSAELEPGQSVAIWSPITEFRF